MSANPSGPGRDHPSAVPPPRPWTPPDTPAVDEELLLRRLAVATASLRPLVYLRAKSLYDERCRAGGCRLVAAPGAGSEPACPG